MHFRYIFTTARVYGSTLQIQDLLYSECTIPFENCTTELTFKAGTQFWLSLIRSKQNFNIESWLINNKVLRFYEGPNKYAILEMSKFLTLGLLP